MARHPQYFHFVEFRQHRLRRRNQRQQAGDRGMFAAIHLIDGDAAVAVQLESTRTRRAGQVQGRGQGAQFGFVVATVEAASNRLLSQFAPR